MAVVTAAVAAGAIARAQPDQDLLDYMPADPPGYGGTKQELLAWHLFQADKLIDARQAAEKVVRRHPRSYIGHFVLGLVQHYGEANFPKALYEEKKALALYEAAYGPMPTPDEPWRWHAKMLQELADTEGNLEHYAARLRFIARYNALYRPHMVAERAWALMKMGRYADARKAAEAGIATGDEQQIERALNALCAIEFEAGHDGESYKSCRQALDYSRAQGTVKAVDLTNFAEGSRSLFKLDEAERALLEATKEPVSAYADPWMDLGYLYTREGRFAEAFDALRQVPGYRARRPPSVRDSDRNESRRVVAAFLLAVGRAKDAIRITSKALVMPDRRSQNSRDPAQDRAVVALVDRRARLVAAERLIEDATPQPVWARAWAWTKAEWLRFEAWMSGRQAARLLGDDRRFVGTFRIGTSKSAIMPPWLAGELVGVAGPAVVHEAVEKARAEDHRKGAAAYYDAFDAEAELAEGHPGRAVALAKRALDGLEHAEVMLRARVMALAGQAEREEGRYDRAAAYWQHAFDADPGVMRRLGLALPVHMSVGGDEVARKVADALERSPRLDVGSWGFGLRVDATAAGGRVCLIGSDNQVIGCGEAKMKTGDDVDAVAARIVRAFHAQVFAPRIDMSQADINSLDGSNRVSRNPLQTLFDRTAPPPDDESGSADDSD